MVQEGPYAIPALGAQFTLRAWLPTDGMQYHPPRYDAWVRFVGVPLQMWNSEGINRLTARLGTVQSIMPYGLQARQLEHITVHLSTKHPRHIPKYLKVKMGDFDKRVRVKLLTWRADHPANFPPPPDATERRQPVRRTQPRQQRVQPSATNRPYSSSSSDGSNAHPWAAQSYSTGTETEQVRLNKHKMKGIWVSKPKVDPLVVPAVEIKPTKSPLDKGKRPMYMLVNQSVQSTKEKVDRLIQVMNQPDKEPVRVCSMEKNMQIVTQKVTVLGSTVTLRMGSVMATIILIGPEVIPFRRMLGINWLRSNQTFWETTVTKSAGLAVGVQEQRTFTVGRINEKVTDGKDGNSWTPHIVKGKISSLQALQCTAQPSLQSPTVVIEEEQDLNLQMEEHLQQGPTSEEDEIDHPQGFGKAGSEAHSPDQAPTSENRRSPRIKRKMDGPYVPMIERAQKVLGYEVVQTKKKKNTKPKPAAPPNITYMQSKEPLTEIQASLVIAAAGVEMEETLEEQVIKAAMTSPPPSEI